PRTFGHHSWRAKWVGANLLLSVHVRDDHVIGDDLTLVGFIRSLLPGNKMDRQSCAAPTKQQLGRRGRHKLAHPARRNVDAGPYLAVGRVKDSDLEGERVAFLRIPRGDADGQPAPVGAQRPDVPQLEIRFGTEATRRGLLGRPDLNGLVGGYVHL